MRMFTRNICLTFVWERRSKSQLPRILTGDSWGKAPPQDSALQFIAGGGLAEDNLDTYLDSSCREFHFGRAARTPFEPTAPVDAAKVSKLTNKVRIFNLTAAEQNS